MLADTSTTSSGKSQKTLVWNALPHNLFAGDANLRRVSTEEKKEREHLLALNQVIARQVMEKSRQVAGTANITMSLFES